MRNLFKNLLFICLVISFIKNSQADSIEVSSLVSGVWNYDTVNVTGDISLRESETLLITSGVKVLFAGPYFFEVNGSLKVMGSEIHPVIFTVSDTTGFSNDTLPDGGWKQIRIENLNPDVDSIIFDHCQFIYAKAVNTDSVYGYGGALCIRNSAQVAIRNSIFYSNYAFYNGGAVYLENADIMVVNNHFELNRCGKDFAFYGYGGALCTKNGEPVIMRNTFYKNSSGSLGGGLCIIEKDGMVSHNVFDENNSLLGGGFAILNVQNPGYAIHNNLFIHNNALYFGSAIANNNSSPLYVNNTIYGNHGEGGGGGFYCKDSVAPILFNNIIYGNTQFGGMPNQVYLWDLLSQPNFYFNNIEGGTESFYGTGGSAFSGDYENNIDADPQFVEFTYTPEPQSPCVNAGNPDLSGLFVPVNDLSGNTRIVDGRIDMGAYENQLPVGVYGFINGHDNFSADVFPNPAIDQMNISFSIETKKQVSISVVTYDGKYSENIFSGCLEKGDHQVKWEIKNPAIFSGVCFIILKVDNRTYEKPVIVAG
jgi:hypothetical protein